MNKTEIQTMSHLWTHALSKLVQKTSLKVECNLHYHFKKCLSLIPSINSILWREINYNDSILLLEDRNSSESQMLRLKTPTWEMKHIIKQISWRKLFQLRESIKSANTNECRDTIDNLGKILRLRWSKSRSMTGRL